MESDLPFKPRKEKSTKPHFLKVIIAIITLIFITGDYCFSQSNKTEQDMNSNINREDRFVVLNKRIEEAGDDFVSLTKEEYELLLSRPVGKVDGFESRTTFNGIDIGIGGEMFNTDIQIVFPFIPNIGDGDVFILFDYIKTVDGRDFLDRESNTECNSENKENQFTELALDNRKTNQKSYWFGSRYVNMKEITLNAAGVPEAYSTGRTFRDMNFGTASGKVIIHLPTNITGIVLKNEDIGKAKSFVGELLTLKEISKDRISFQFSGDTKKIYTWTVYDSKGNVLDENGVSKKDGVYQISAKSPQSIKIYSADIVREEYPFVFGSHTQNISKEISSVQKKVPMLSGQTTDAPDETINEIQTKKAEPVYLDKNDPIFISIKGRAVNDFKHSIERLNPNLPENKLILAKVEKWPQEKQNQLQDLSEKSLKEYAAQTHINIETFILILSAFGALDLEKMADMYGFRVQDLGENKYIAEFWEDLLAENINAEAIALGENITTDHKDEIKERFANGRKNIADGIIERYSKVMALYYSIEKDGLLTYHDPIQPMYDFIK